MKVKRLSKGAKQVVESIHTDTNQLATEVMDLGNLAVGVAMQDKRAATEPTEACRELQGMRGSAKLVEIPDTERYETLCDAIVGTVTDTVDTITETVDQVIDQTMKVGNPVLSEFDGLTDKVDELHNLSGETKQVNLEKKAA